MSQERTVAYHYTPDDQLSLVHATDSQTDAIAVRDDRSEPLVRIIGYPFDELVFVVYAGSHPSKLDEYEQLKARAEQQLATLDEADQTIAIRLLRLLNSVRKNSDTTVAAYKKLELDAVGDATEQVDWQATLPDVAGQLMSNLILRHPLPNANHRTGVAMLQLCIEATVGTFEMPRTHVSDAEWKPWVNTYIEESKRYLTVRRNNARFAALADLNVDTVRRKGGIEINLDRFELDMGIRKAWEFYARRHEELCVGFAEEVVARALGFEYQDITGPSREEFAGYLAAEVSDDPKRLF